ncbi:hypothetical protein J8J04_00970 ['Fragaria x ananassa' phyllody phytoplasma]|uniref:Uncharacterized protein n=1 Tax='Fragaria x ananassa' phyllody phytoplasma TaxID=2358428 RepID=A0ABS5K301_9MOLU|nr:hypothetical protein ['Fragaria x ananassa' phyllody phytoplasma]MBS2126274.1 hypothetical protein ['Fragaria x ananassa' phyllody phytoplasma]
MAKIFQKKSISKNLYAQEEVETLLQQKDDLLQSGFIMTSALEYSAYLKKIIKAYLFLKTMLIFPRKQFY